MKEWLPAIEALSPVALATTGAMMTGLIQCTIVAWVRRRSRREPVREPGVFPENFPQKDLHQMRADLKQLRADCETSAWNLAVGVEKLKAKAMARVQELGSKADQLQHLQRTLDAKATAIGSLEQQRSEFELWKERHAAQLHQKEAELTTRSATLAVAEQTIAILRGILDLRENDRAPGGDAAGGSEREPRRETFSKLAELSRRMTTAGDSLREPSHAAG